MSRPRSPRPQRLALSLLLAFGAVSAPASADTVMDTGAGHPIAIGWEGPGPELDLGQRYGNTSILGSGRLIKLQNSLVKWGTASATFAMGAGGLIDVQQGSFIGGSGGNEDWSRNLSSLNVNEGAMFHGVEANVRVDVLTGAGLIRSGFQGAGYQSFTFGVANGSGSFAGILADGTPGHFIKVGTGTQVLTGSALHTGGTTISGGTLAIGDGGQGGTLGGEVINNARLVFNRSDDSSFAGRLGGNGELIKRGAGVLEMSGRGSMTGNTVIEAGRLALRQGGSLGSSAATVGAAGNASGTGVEVSGPASSWQVVGELNAPQGALTLRQGGTLSTGSAKLGVGKHATFAISDAGSSWRSGGIWALANGNGTVSNGGRLATVDAFVGNLEGSEASVILSGAGTRWDNSGQISIGNWYAGPNGGSVRIDAGATVATRSLVIRMGSTLTLNGGTLSIEQDMRRHDGDFVWNSGRLVIKQAEGSTLGYGLLGATTRLRHGSVLEVGKQLTVDQGQRLELDGGQIVTPRLVLVGGRISSSWGRPSDLSGVGLLSGRGLVDGPVRGGAANTIVASGGALTLGYLDEVGAYDFGGTLNVAANAHALLLSADAARLGVLTSLQAGSRLSSVNGATLGAGQTFRFAGDASIQGLFTNNGLVAGSAGTLVFHNDVDGSGDFAGNISFKAGYDPGKAAVDFGHGRLAFGADAVLTMTLSAASFDQLLHIDTLSFGGQLNLVFAEGFAPRAGSSFRLFNFDNFSGSFAPERITVSGYDRSRLDFSALASQGLLQVSAVPEPASYALMLAGLLGLAVLSGRRRRSLSAIIR